MSSSMSSQLLECFFTSQFASTEVLDRLGIQQLQLYSLLAVVYS